MTPRAIAIDWSGALSDAESKIWLAEVQDGQLLRLESGRGRDQIASHLIEISRADFQLVVGLDFAFSLPAWFLERQGLEDAPALWRKVSTEAERWITECEPPFWGRPGRTRPELPEHFRATELEVGWIAGIRAKSVFQIGGAGAVGTGSLRGMPVLARLRDAGFAVWPFDRPRMPLVVEIYPRTLTGAVTKSSPEARSSYLAQRFPDLSREMMERAASSEDAFDALVFAFVMDEHLHELLALGRAEDGRILREGAIWSPRAPALVPFTEVASHPAGRPPEKPSNSSSTQGRSMSTPVQAMFATKGSQRWLQLAVNRMPAIIDRPLIESARLPGSTELEWCSPLASENFVEYSDGDTFRRLGVTLPKRQLEDFWPARGPRWGGLARAKDGNDFFLIEAKAHIGEMVSGRSRASEAPLAKIRESLREVQQKIAPGADEVDWSGTFYQYANRLAHLYLLRELNGLDAHLVYVYFLNAADVGGPSDRAEYEGATKVIEYYLGVRQSRLSRYIHKVYVDVRDLALSAV